MEEIWKVLDIDNRYSVSNLGRVKSLAKGREYISQGWLDHNGYYCLRIKGKLFSIHRLVAKYFIPTDNAQLHIDHIDGNKCNNRADNLRWVTQKENNNNPITRRRISESLKGGKRTPEQRLNMSIAQQKCKPMLGKKHSKATLEKFKERRPPTLGLFGKDNPLSKPVFQFDLNGKFVEEFDNSLMASKKIHIARESICRCCNGKQKTAGGYLWRYQKEIVL